VTLGKKLAALASAATLLTGLGVVATTAARASAPPPINVTNDKVTCNSVVGTIKFATPLSNAGSPTGSNQINIKVTLDGCTDTTNANAKIGASKLKGTISTNNGTQCVGLFGPSNVSASTTVKWKAQSGTPKLVMTGNVPAASTVTINQTAGSTYNSDTWGATYGAFAVTAGHAGVSGAFTGGNGGATSTFTATTGQDVGALGNACAGKGLKSLNFGIGGITLS
jgi:hypothetical protein